MLQNTRAPKFVKEIQLKSHSDPHTLIVIVFNTTFSPTDKSSRQKLNRDIPELTGIINQMDLTDIYRLFYAISYLRKVKD